MTYLTRRYAGVFYARIRVTTCSGRRTLLRFSLGTRDRLEARRHLLAYLSWLLPMQTAADPGQLFDDILTHGRAMVLKGPARTRAEVAHRIRFVDLAWTHRADWIASAPCPIRDHHAYEVQEEVRWTLMMLNEMLKEDMPRLEMKRDDIDGGWMRDEAIEALCFDAATGRVRAYLPDEFRDMYDADPDVEFGVREGKVSIYDMYLEADGRKKKVHIAPPPARPTSAGDRSRSATPSARTAVKDEAGVAPASASTLLSAAKRDFLAARRIAKGDGRAEEDAGLIIDFMIDFIGDKPIADITPDDLHAFEIAMASTPDRLRIPKDHAASLYKRYAYAKEHGFAGLKMLSEKRVSNVWHRCLHQFFRYLDDKGKGQIKYQFDLMPANASEATERDAWTDDEMIKLFSLPLFTGCASKEHIWTAGTCLVQNELYWAYLLIFFTGMRNSEIGTLKVANVICDAGTWMFDLGTKQRRTVKRTQTPNATPLLVKRKSKAGHRRIPIPRLLIDLGILARVEDLRRDGVAALFPEWKGFKNRKSGRDMPGHHMSKSWQYIKGKFGFVGDELTIYGGRHTRAGWYDMTNVPELIKRKLLGHAPRDAHESYGFNALTVDEARMALVELPIETQIAGILILAKLRAEYDELTVLRSW